MTVREIGDGAAVAVGSFAYGFAVGRSGRATVPDVPAAVRLLPTDEPDGRDGRGTGQGRR